MQSDAARFATFREAQREKELKALTSSSDKAKLEKRYADYLKTEKQTIFARSASAERWMGFEENADIYPNLQWRTAGDGDVRPEHAALNGLTLPINDPFWMTHNTPLDWGCRCELIQTDEPANNKEEKYSGYEETRSPKGFDINPGIDQKLFNDNAGYYTSFNKTESAKLTGEALQFIGKQSRELVLSELANTAIKVKAPQMSATTVSFSQIETITNQPHSAVAMRNTLFFDLKNAVKESKFIMRVNNSNYYQVKGLDNMFLEFKELANGEIKLNAILDSI